MAARLTPNRTTYADIEALLDYVVEAGAAGERVVMRFALFLFACNASSAPADGSSDAIGGDSSVGDSSVGDAASADADASAADGGCQSTTLCAALEGGFFVYEAGTCHGSTCGAGCTCDPAPLGCGCTDNGKPCVPVNCGTIFCNPGCHCADCTHSACVCP